MGKYSLVFKKSVAKDLQGITKQTVSRLLTCVEALAEDPRGKGCEKVSGQERSRRRQGLYRIAYEIQDDVLVVIVVKVGHLRDVYSRS